MIVDFSADPLGEAEDEVAGMDRVGDRDEVPQQHLVAHVAPSRRNAFPLSTCLQGADYRFPRRLWVTAREATA